MNIKKQNRISSNLVRNRYRDVPEDLKTMRFEGCGNSLDWSQRMTFDSSVWAHSVRKDFRVTHVHNKRFLAVSARTSNWICKLSAHLLHAYRYGIWERCEVAPALVYYELTSWRQVEIICQLHSSATLPLDKIPVSIEFLRPSNFTANPVGRAV